MLKNWKKEMMSHFIAWDGHRIYDQDCVATVNERDRSTTETSNQVFETIFNKNLFLSWQVGNVYEL